MSASSRLYQRRELGEWLWEPVWELNGSHPGTDVQPKVDLVRRVIGGLLETGVIDLWVSSKWPDPPSRKLDEGGVSEGWRDIEAWSNPEQATIVVTIRLREVTGGRGS